MIFLDSSFIIALAVSDDQYHEKAVEILPRVGPLRVVSDLVISESVSAVGSRLGAKAGRTVFENLLYDSTTRTMFSNKRLFERALLVCAKYDGRLSLADAVTALLMFDLKVKEIASFDSDFDRVEGIRRIS